MLRISEKFVLQEVFFHIPHHTKITQISWVIGGVRVGEVTGGRVEVAGGTGNLPTHSFLSSLLERLNTAHHPPISFCFSQLIPIPKFSVTNITASAYFFKPLLCYLRKISLFLLRSLFCSNFQRLVPN